MTGLLEIAARWLYRFSAPKIVFITHQPTDTKYQLTLSGVKHLETLPLPRPAVNQIELHPWCQQNPIVAYCRAHNIAIQAYCPLVRADPERFNDPVLQSICEKTGKGPAQVLIRWSLQKG